MKNIDKGILELENMIIFLLAQKDLKIYLMLSEAFSYNDATSETHKTLIKKLYELYETGDINNKDLMNICENDEERSTLSGLLIKESTKEDLEKKAIEIVKKVNIEKMQKEKNDLLKKMQNATTEDERRLLETKLNEVIIKLAQK